MRLTRREALVLGLGAALAPVAARARVRGRVLMRMDGYLGPPLAGRHEQADLVFRVADKDYRFQVTKAVMLSGGGMPSDVFSRLAPYKPSLVLRGPAELLSRFVGAAPDGHLSVSGQLTAGSRNFLVSAVEPAAAPVEKAP
jgi:hypothetical protein